MLHMRVSLLLFSQFVCKLFEYEILQFQINNTNSQNKIFKNYYQKTRNSLISYLQYNRLEYFYLIISFYFFIMKVKVTCRFGSFQQLFYNKQKVSKEKKAEEMNFSSKKVSNSFFQDVQNIQLQTIKQQINQTDVSFINRFDQSKKLQNGIQTENKETLDQDAERRVNQNPLVYIWVLAATVVSGFQIIVLNSNIENDLWSGLAIGFMVFKLMGWIISILTVRKWKKAARLFILVDNILVAQIASSYVLITLSTIESKGQVTVLMVVYFVFNTLISQFQSCSFRVMITYCHWSKFQLIIYKLVIGSCSIFNLAYGCYYYIVDVSKTNGMDPALDKKLKDFIILYTCTVFEYFLQMHSKITDFDGTAQLQAKYSLSRGKSQETPQKTQKENSENQNQN